MICLVEELPLLSVTITSNTHGPEPVFSHTFGVADAGLAIAALLSSEVQKNFSGLFPCGLNEPDADYTGGEFVVVEQRPRAQSRATTQTIPKGHGIVITTRDRPIESARGWASAPMRHGVSTVRSGVRHTIGVLFHDAT